MTQINYQAAAQELLSRRVAGTKAPRLVTEQRPLTIDDALRIQAEMVAQNSSPVGGWKCLLPLAEDKFIVAPIFADSIHQGAQCELFEDNQAARLEPEIAFILNTDLPARPEGYSEAEVEKAIGSCHMALELMQSRFADDSGAEFYERLADCLVNQGMFIGPKIDKQLAIDAATVNISVKQGDSIQQFDGKHPNSAPLAPVFWMVNFLSQRGVSLQAGQAIITGSFCGIVEVAFDQPTTIKYDKIGEYTVTLIRK